MCRSQYQQMDLGCFQQGLACPGASSWGNWGSRGQLLQGSISCVCIHFLLTDLHPELPERGTALGSLCLHECFCLCSFVWLSTYRCVYHACAHVCPRGIHANGLTKEHGAAAALPLSRYWIQWLPTKVTNTTCVQEPGNLSIY